MRTNLARAVFAGALLIVVGLGSYAMAGGGTNNVKAHLETFQEVPSVSTGASGDFEAKIDDSGSIAWSLSYANLTAGGTVPLPAVQQAHIHFGQTGVNGGISVWLCSNLASPPTPAWQCH